jgi:hypothetical protein
MKSKSTWSLFSLRSKPRDLAREMRRESSPIQVKKPRRETLVDGIKGVR